MNLQILSAHIVARVHHSPDSAHNLATVVANLIREELSTEPINLKLMAEEIVRRSEYSPALAEAVSLLIQSEMKTLPTRNS